jgi:hypothetical protein
MTATSAWRSDGNRCWLKAAGQRYFLEARAVSYFNACSEPAGDATFVKAKEFLSRGCRSTAGARPVSDNTGPRGGRSGEPAV